MPYFQQSSKPLWVAFALAASACGGAPLNPGKLAQAQTAVHVAETLGAEQDPKAQQSLQLARDQVDRAKRLGADGDGEEGDLYLERATADAELAAQLMRTRSEAEKAREAWAKSQSIGGPGQAQE
jgi:hypothetical protein